MSMPYCREEFKLKGTLRTKNNKLNCGCFEMPYYKEDDIYSPQYDHRGCLGVKNNYISVCISLPSSRPSFLPPSLPSFLPYLLTYLLPPSPPQRPPPLSLYLFLLSFAFCLSFFLSFFASLYLYFTTSLKMRVAG